jgi:hypothetical protein
VFLWTESFAILRGERFESTKKKYIKRIGMNKARRRAAAYALGPVGMPDNGKPCF